MRKIFVSFACLLCLHICLACAAPRPALTAAAEEESYACALSYDVYLYEAEDETSGLFCIPYTYYVKLLSAGTEYCYVQYSTDSPPYAAVYGYCRTDELHFVDFVPERPFLYYPLDVTYSLAGGAAFPAGDDVFSTVTLTYAYYGDYTVGSATYWYVAHEGTQGYLPKTADISYDLNTDFEASMPENNEQNVGSGDMPVAQIVLGVTLGILAVGVTYYLLRPRRPRPQKAESDFDA